MRGHAEGNYLRKTKRTYYVTNDCHRMALELTLQYGVNVSCIIELAIREKYLKVIGPYKPIPYPNLQRDSE